MMQQKAFWVYSGKDEELELSFSTFNEAAEVAAKIPQGEVFQSMERLAGFCTDCDQFEEGGEGGAMWTEGSDYRVWDWVCPECLERRQDAIEGGCGSCTRASFCHCRGY